MSRTITRTLPTTIVTGVIMVEGKEVPEIITRTYEGVKLTKNQALNELKKEFKTRVWYQILCMKNTSTKLV